jgi:hypothetical protein
MSIGSYNGVSAGCNICGKLGPLLRYDSQRWNNGAQHQDYTNELKRKAETVAIQEGFVVIERLQPNGNGGFIRNDLHVCPSCVDDIKFASEPKKPNKKTGSHRKKLT